MSDLVETLHPTTDAAPDPVDTPAAETQRIVQSGTIWLAAVLVTSAVGLGPLLASGWRPSDLPMLAALGFWLGVVTAAAGTASLIWAGCPTLGFPLMQAWKQKVYCVRFGIVSAVSGMALVGFSLLVSPA
ncbi:hypothetical protein [Pseudolysinimonas sp.]|uniref:hypothetical protein n=1 Tax=Pseudolysinimonas sp. TaxID=2680009 RepID=UPI003F7E026D